MKYLRRIYDWIISWATKPFGSYALFTLAFCESSFSPIPPDALLVALIIGHKTKHLRFAAICTLGSVLGGFIGYFIGWGLWDLTSDFFFTYIPGFSEELFSKTRIYYNKWSFWIVLTAGFTPIPYAIFTISSGVFNINIWGFILASTLGRATRFYIVSILVGIYGDRIKTFIDKYFNMLIIVFTVMLIGGILTSKFLLSN